MAYDRPSWKEIDRMRDKTGRRKKRENRDNREHEIREHSTRYDKYKQDLNRLFDQGLAGELLKKPDKEKDQEPSLPKVAGKAKSKSKAAVVTRKAKEGRIPKDSQASTSRLKLIRGVIDAEDSESLIRAVDELSEGFGLPDDWGVLVRVLEHPNEKIVLEAVTRMKVLLPNTVKIPRRFTLRERLRSISQTASDGELRQLAAEMEDRL
jgi:hypothetical protein